MQVSQPLENFDSVGAKFAIGRDHKGVKRFAAGQACGETFVNFVLFNGSQSLVRILSQTGGTVKVHNTNINDGSGAMLKQASEKVSGGLLRVGLWLQPK